MNTVSKVFLGVYALICIVCIGDWARVRTPKGGWGILTPAGFVWIIQLGCIVFVALRHDSALRLLWLVPLSIVVYMVVARILHSTGGVEG